MPQPTHCGRAAGRRRRNGPSRYGRARPAVDAARPACCPVEVLEGRRLLAFAPIGPEFPVNVFTANQQANPAVAADGDGDFVVAWESYDQDGDKFGIYARRYNAAGVPQQAPGAPAGVTEFRVNTTTAGAQAGAAVAMDADGDFVVVWRHFAQNGAVVGIYAQRYDAAGVAQGSEFLVNTTTTTLGQGAPTVATNVRGEFVVAWQSFGQDGDGTGVYARRYDAVGIPQGPEFRVNTYTTSDQSFPSAAMDASGDFAIAWQSAGQDGSGLGVYAQRYSAAGGPQGGEFRVNATTVSNQLEPCVAMDADGDFVVSWSEGYTAEYTSEYNVRAQRFDAAGVAQGDELLVNTFPTSTQRVPAAAMDADGDFLVTWESYGQDGSGNGVYGQLYSAAGVEQGDEFRVNSHTFGVQRSAAVAVAPDGDCVVAWVSAGQDGSLYGVYAQRYNESTDTAGPVVSGLSADGAPVRPGRRLSRAVTSLAVQFSENLSVAGGTGGANSATDPGNYGLTRDGTDVSSLITSVSFALNPDTRKYEAALTLSAQLTSASYVLTVREALRDEAAGNALDGNLDGVPGGGDFALAFVVHDIAPTGFEFRVNTFTAGNQRFPAVASDADGDFVVAWTSDGQDFDNSDGVYAQRYDAAGFAQGAEFRVNTPAAGAQRNATVAMDADGDFVIVWEGYGLEGDAFGIYAKRYNAAGVPRQVPGTADGVTEFRVNVTIPGGQSDPSAAMDADGDFVVAWTSDRQDGSALGVYGQRFNAAGSPQGGEFLVNTNTAGSQSEPSVAMDADGDFVVAWSGNGTGDGFGVFARRFDAAGQAQGNELLVNTTAADVQRQPSAAMDADGDFVVAWQSNPMNLAPNVFVRRYDALAVPQGDEFLVNGDLGFSRQRPSAAMDAAGNFVVAWQADGTDFPNASSSVFARRFDAAGVPEQAPGAPAGVNTEFRVNTTTLNQQAAPCAAMDADGDFVVAWQSYGEDGSTPSTYGIFAQRYALNRAPTAVGIGDVIVPQDAPDTDLSLWDAFDDPNTADDTLSFSLVGNTNPDLFSYTEANTAGGTLALGYAPGRSGQATLTVRATDPGGLFTDTSFTVTVGDTLAPRVAAVYVDGTAWSATFRQFLQDSGLGSAARGFRVDGAAAQFDEMPWTNVNRFHVVFSEDVIVDLGDLAVGGINTASYALDAAAFAYDPATFTATWALANGARLANDRVLLDLDADAGGVTDKAPAANALDGEWGGADGFAVFPSGDGAAGGDFQFQMNFLPGDVNRNGGIVNSLDVQAVRIRQFTSPTNPGTPPNTYTAFFDVDGSAFMNAIDVQQVRIRQFSQLPGGNPAVAAPAWGRPAANLWGAARIDWGGPRGMGDREDLLA